MITLNSLTKTYKSKKDNACIAVNDISIDFGDSGLVFIVGKSGSGKSTLLNLMAGLDTADSGEIIIDGKSGKDFSQADFDSYRNGYVGFVFQDFSIIDDLNIGENISLAVQLQNKSITNEDIANVLAMVDLAGYDKRQSNELSGGQKQRVAIARALIKDPKIIFADEPTGSLDSNSGKHILQLFRQLSKTRLVIVVSHDIDSALEHGDRIIELADGKVISDRTKTGQVNLVQIKKQYQEKINQSFVETIVVQTENKDNFVSMPASLPFKSSLKIALSTFAKKKLKFVFTVCLMIVALTVFGLSSTLKYYDYIDASLSTFDKLDISTLSVASYENIEGELQDEQQIVEFDKEKLVDLLTNAKTSVYHSYKIELAIAPYNSKEVSTSIYHNIIGSIVELDSDVIDESKLSTFYNAKLIIGKYPKTNKNCIEIVISDYLADSIMYWGARFNNKDVLPNTGYDNLLDGTLSMFGVDIKIVGVFATDYKSVDFQAKKDFQATFNISNVYSAVLTTKDGVYNNAVKNNVLKVNSLLKDTSQEYAQLTNAVIMGINNVQDVVNTLPEALRPEIKYATGYDNTSKLKDNEIVVTMSYLRDVLLAYDTDAEGIFTFSFADINMSQLQEKTFELTLHDEQRRATADSLKIVAIINDESSSMSYFSGAYMLTSNSLKNSCVQDSMRIFNVYLPITTNYTSNKLLIQYLQDNNMEFYTFATNELKLFDSLFKLISSVLDATSLCLFLFALLLISNFIASSILSKKKEIGILRAMGASGKDIAKIFAIESVGIVILNIVFATVLMLVGTVALNAALTSSFPISLTIVSFNLLSWLLMIGSCLLIVTIASIIPLIQISKKRPIDAIKGA